MKSLFYQAMTALFAPDSLSSEFTFLPKGEPSSRQSKLFQVQTSKNKSKKKFAWAVDESKYLTLSQVKKLRVYCEENKNLALNPVHIRDWFLIELGLFTGLRVSEMASLKIGDLNLENNQSSLIVRNGKGGKSRIVYFGSEFKKSCIFFLQWKKQNNQPIEKDNYLLTDKSDNQITKRALQKAFKRCLYGAGLDRRYGIHCLQHTFATRLVQAGIDLYVVKELLGHKTIAMTMRYAHHYPESLRHGVEVLDKNYYVFTTFDKNEKTSIQPILASA